MFFYLLVNPVETCPVGEEKKKEKDFSVSSTYNLAFKSPAAFCLACSSSPVIKVLCAIKLV